MDLSVLSIFRNKAKKPEVVPVTVVEAAPQWKVFEQERPSNEVAHQSVFVAYCFNGFVTVCRWDPIEQVFKNMTGTRVINFVAKWLPLPDTKNYVN